MKPDKQPTERSGSKPLFWTITGEDFKRSIKWARSEPNLVREAIQKKIKELNLK